MYKAKIDIGSYKKGDVVPDTIAQTWVDMYVVSPVEQVSDKEDPIKEITEDKPVQKKPIKRK
jgi:hypothetical protein